jgi:hypothetical protein
MRIIENSSARLRLRETMGYLPAFLASAAVLIAIVVVVRHDDPKQLINAFLFGAAAVFFRRESRITFDKSARRCGIWRQDMWRRSYRTIPFDDIEDVQVEIETPDTDALTHSRLSLLTAAGPVPLTAGFSATLDWQISLRETMVDVIFLGRPRPAPIDPVQLLLKAGRPFAAARRA